MKKAILIAVVLACGLVLNLYPAFSQDDMVIISNEVFPSPQRPACVFKHDEHNEKAGIEDCSACHHVYEDGKLVQDDSSEGTPCAECHKVNAKTGTPLMLAYHMQCIDCHTQKGKGPVACGQCHVKR